MLNIIIIHALRKTSSLPKPLKTLLLSLAVSDLGVGLLVQPLDVAYLVMRLKKNTENSLTIKNTVSVLTVTVQFFLLCFIPWCNSSNSRQILGNSSSSQIPRTCDSQARCRCGDLNLVIQCKLFNSLVVDPKDILYRYRYICNGFFSPYSIF